MKAKSGLRATGKTRNYRKKTGLPPGTLVYTGSSEIKTTLDLFTFNQSSIARSSPTQVADLASLMPNDGNSWLNCTGLSDTQLIDEIGAHFKLHPLLLEDILNTSAMPKIEDYSDVLYISLKMLRWIETEHTFDTEQVSFVVGKNYLISFQEKPGDVFEPFRERLLSGVSKARNRGSDFLAYILTDKIVDQYFTVLEKIENLIENAELDLIGESPSITARDLMHLKKQLILLRKYIYPLRDEVRKLLRTESGLVDRKTGKYIDDIYDHLQNIIQNLETFRDTISSLMDLYSSTVSNKLNNVMKTLTIVGAIFIPLTFLAGLYGMNFNYMPELQYRWSYPVLLGVMFTIAIGMFIYMKSRKWF